MLIVFIFIFSSCGKNNLDINSKKIDIYNVVKEAFLTDKGYTDGLSVHMSEEVFKNTNIYNAYSINPKNKEFYRVDFSLMENSQNTKKDKVYVKMTYSVVIIDDEGKTMGGSKDIPITFTVKLTDNEWYIIDKFEPA